MTHAFDIERGSHLFFHRKTILVKKGCVAIPLYFLHIHELLLILMDFPIHVDRISMELPIFFKGSQVEISKL